MVYLSIYLSIRLLEDTFERHLQEKERNLVAPSKRWFRMAKNEEESPKLCSFIGN